LSERVPVISLKQNYKVNSTAQIDKLKQLVSQKLGLRFPPDGHDRFVKTLYDRVARSGCATLKEYRTFLLGNEAAYEWETFVRAFTSVETFFFRDHGQFDLLRLRLLPELIERHSNDKTLRLWSAGCSSGEEAYSLAMLVDMLLPDRNIWKIFILGTDLDSMAITKAQQGYYRKWSFRMFPEAMRQRYFNNADVPSAHSLNSDQHLFLINERIRNMVTFQVGNLVGDPFPDADSCLHDMDLILCRNVFIYFDSVAVPAVATKFAATLVNKGYLMTAHTELIGHSIKGLESKLFAEGVVYQRHDYLPVWSNPEATQDQPISREHNPSHYEQANLASQSEFFAHQAEDKIDAFSHKLTPAWEQGGAWQGVQVALQTRPHSVDLCASARSHADRGEYDLAEEKCREALAADPLAASAYFLLAQLFQIKGNLIQATEFLNKTIYLDPRCVAGYLELAALYERDGNVPYALTLRRTALGIVRTLPSDEQIEQYERTAGELAQWLMQFDSKFEVGSEE